jgi:hypothetical protein
MCFINIYCIFERKRKAKKAKEDKEKEIAAALTLKEE